VFFALLEYFVVLFGIRYDKYWRHKKQDLERINATTWERPNENTQPALAAVAAAAAAAAASNNTNSTNHHRPTQLPPLLHHRVTNNRVDNLRLFGGSSKIVPQEETQDHHTKQMASPRSTIIRVSFNNNVIIICLIYMQPKLIKNTVLWLKNWVHSCDYALQSLYTNNAANKVQSITSTYSLIIMV